MAEFAVPRRGSVVILTDVPPRPDYPNGFSARLYNVVQAMRRRWEVDLAAPLGTYWQNVCGTVTAESFAATDLDVRRVVAFDVGVNPRFPPAPHSRRHRIAHYALHRDLPLDAHPIHVRPLGQLIRRTRPEMVLIYREYFSQLAADVPRSTPIVFMFEELSGFYTSWMAGARLAEGRHEAVARRERAREVGLYARVASRARLNVAISQPEADRFAALVPDARTTVVPHGIDCGRYSPRPADGFDYDVAVLGFMLDRSTYEDAVAVFRASRSHADERVRAWRWGFVGVGTETLPQLLDADAICVGPVPDLRAHYARARVVIVPSNHGVGVKTTALQAWAMGRPVVGTPRSLRDLETEPGVNVEVAMSPEGIVERARALLDDPDRAERMGAAGRATALRHRDMRTIAADFAELCASALANQPSSEIAPRSS